MLGGPRCARARSARARSTLPGQDPVGDPVSFGYGGTGADTIQGTPQPDLLRGHAGDDVIRAFGGSDIIIPGPGHDEVWAGSGDDVIWIHDECELEGKEKIICGPGYDIVVTPVPAFEFLIEGGLPKLKINFIAAGCEEIIVTDGFRHRSECYWEEPFDPPIGNP